jgi:uncharacterized RDD family membrane protein YckC
MARFREVKNKKHKPTSVEPSTPTQGGQPLTFLRFKAFITDMFMLMMPIMYITTYMVLDGKEAFQASEVARWSGALIFGLIVIAFWLKAGQTPGMRSQSIKVVRFTNEEKITFIQALIRYLLFLFSAVTVLLLFVPLFRKDRMMFHDILSGTKIITTD